MIRFIMPLSIIVTMLTACAGNNTKETSNLTAGSKNNEKTFEERRAEERAADKIWEAEKRAAAKIVDARTAKIRAKQGREERAERERNFRQRDPRTESVKDRIYSCTYSFCAQKRVYFGQDYKLEMLCRPESASVSASSSYEAASKITSGGAGNSGHNRGVNCS